MAQRDRALSTGPIQFDPEPRQRLRAQRAIAVAEPLERFVEQADEFVVGLARIADAPPRRHHRASKRLRSVDSARKFNRAQASLAGFREIAGFGLGLAEIAEELRLQRLVAARLERQRVHGVAQMLRRLLVGKLLLRRARGRGANSRPRVRHCLAIDPGNNDRRSQRTAEGRR